MTEISYSYHTSHEASQAPPAWQTYAERCAQDQERRASRLEREAREIRRAADRIREAAKLHQA